MTSLPLRISVRDDTGEDPRSIEVASREYVAQLLEDLGLSGPVDVSVEPVRADGLAEGCFSIAIGEHDRIVDSDTSRSIAARVPLSIYRHRGLLLSDAFVDAHASRLWPQHETPGEVRAKLRTFFLDCIERNVSLRRAEAALPNDVSTPSNLWELLCRVHTDEQVTLEVAGLPAGASLRWKELQASVFAEAGLLCPIPVVGSRSDLAPDEVQVRLNDVHLPVQIAPPGAKVEDELPGFLRQIVLSTPLALLTCDAVRRRMDFVKREAPAAVKDVNARLGVEGLTFSIANRLREGVSVRDFRWLLDNVILELARYGAPSVSQ